MRKRKTKFNLRPNLICSVVFQSILSKILNLTYRLYLDNCISILRVGGCVKNPTGQNRKSSFWAKIILFLINVFFWLLIIVGALFARNNGSNLFFIFGIFVTLISLILWSLGSTLVTAIKESTEASNNRYNLKATYLQNRNEILLTISVIIFIVSIRLAFIPQIVNHKAGSIEWYLQITL